MSAPAPALKLKLKLSTAAPLRTHDDVHATPDSVVVTTAQQKQLLIGARGGAALKDLLSTAPNPEVAIRGFQDAHGLTWTPTLSARDAAGEAATRTASAPFTPAVQLLDLLAVPRSSVYSSLLETLKSEMLLRIDELPQRELQRVLEVTFPYIEFRELRAIPIAVLARQDETPEMYLRELTENRKILHELPVHVRRKIMHVDPQELHVFVEACTHEYVEQMAEWYLKHPGQPTASTASTAAAAGATSARSHADHNHSHTATNVDTSVDLWNVSSHMPSSASASASSAAASARQSRWGLSPEERRRTSPALAKLTEMLGDSEALYLATVEILKEYVVAANIPGSRSTMSSPKEYVDYVPFLGALRADLANLQRDRTTVLLRTDPLHKFIWFLDRALKQQTLEPSQLHELLGFLAKLRTGDLPPNKKFKKKTSGGAVEADDEDENFEVVLGPPPVDELLALLDKIAKTDVRQIFAEPVPDDVPTYRDVIKEPMDLSTMRKKAKRGKYKSVEMFADDFHLMIRNCMAFNPDTTVFYKEGKRIGKRGTELIEKSLVALRGEPQRIRAKKRRKVGPSEAVSMLTSTGVAALRDFGDVDQSGMVPEGLCDDMLADAAMVLSDPPVKQLLCDALMKHLVQCWQKRELPTDNLVCRGLVQLLQVGNASSVRRMIRKRDFVLRAPQVVTMRVVLPLLLRSMAAHRVYFAFPAACQRDAKTKDDVLDSALWEHVLRASSAIRTMTKGLAVQCLVDHQVEFAAQLLHFVLTAEDDVALRDRALLHAVAEVVLEHVKTALGSDHSSDAMASDRVQNLSVWKCIVRDFFLAVLEQRIEAAKEISGTVVVLADAEVDDPVADDAKARSSQTVKSFPVPVFQEKVAMLLVSVLHLVEKADASAASVTEDFVAPLVKRSLGALRSCCASLREFELLWASTAFRGCREQYEQLLIKCPILRDELFRATPVALAALVAGDELQTATATSEPVNATREQREPAEQEVAEQTTIEQTHQVQEQATQEATEQDVTKPAEQDVAKQTEQDVVKPDQDVAKPGQDVVTQTEQASKQSATEKEEAANGTTESPSGDEEGEVEEGEERA